MSSDDGLQDSIERTRQAFRLSHDSAPSLGRREGDATNGAQAAVALHPFFRGLLEALPEPGATWPQSQREQWLETARHIFALLYADVEEPQRSLAQHPGHSAVRSARLLTTILRQAQDGAPKRSFSAPAIRLNERPQGAPASIGPKSCPCATLRLRWKPRSKNAKTRGARRSGARRAAALHSLARRRSERDRGDGGRSRGCRWSVPATAAR